MAMNKVAFTAAAERGGSYGPFETEQIVVLNSVVTNIGNGYDNSTGIFKAPVSGYYNFSFSYHAAAQFPTGLVLKKNNQIIVEAYNNKPQGPEFTDNAGNSACLELRAGDQVSVYLPAKSAVWASGRSTTFSGFLISLL